MLTHLSLCTGIGGIDLAAEKAGFITVGQCEIADYPYNVLCKNWPSVTKWRDIKDVTANSVKSRGIGTINIVTGGIPCQPHSTSGERKASDDERDLWGEQKRIISEVKSTWAMVENVPGIFTSESGRFFGNVLADMAGMGYNAAWFTPEAFWTGADFEGKRVYIVASTYGGRWPEVVCSYIASHTKKSFEEKAVTAYTHFSIVERLEKSLGESSILGDGYGVPNRMDRLKCCGNAVDQRQAYPILQAIADIENGLVF